jgi:hypothetical protein
MAMSDISPPANSSLRADVQQLSQQQRRAAAAANKSSSYSSGSGAATSATRPSASGKPGQYLNIVV